MKYVYLVACIANAGVIGISAALGDTSLFCFSFCCLALSYVGFSRSGAKDET